jgi:beta-galactosidase GanA
VLEILVEGMGRINYGQSMIDRKGITDRVTLNGMTLMNWQVYNLSLDDAFIGGLKRSYPDTARRGYFFHGTFSCGAPADTYIDMSGYEKGVVWVNGHNLGRYWNIGPQQRLYCPAPWLKKGGNEILVFDLHRREPTPIRGMETLD